MREIEGVAARGVSTEMRVFCRGVGESLHPLLAEWPYVSLDDWADIKRS